MNRAEVLDTAKRYVTQDRQTVHGPAEDTFGLIAKLWSAYLTVEVTPVDVANLMVLLKVARAQQNPQHYDNYTDMAGYAACAAELAHPPQPPPNGPQG